MKQKWGKTEKKKKELVNSNDIHTVGLANPKQVLFTFLTDGLGNKIYQELTEKAKLPAKIHWLGGRVLSEDMFLQLLTTVPLLKVEHSLIC